jgi:hypothetical protein
MHKLKFEKHIAASPAKVFEVMLSPKTYPSWAGVFHPGSHYDGEMKPDGVVHFVGTNEKTGLKDGMISRIVVYEPGMQISFQNVGLVHQGEEILDGEAIKEWLGAMEEYFLDDDGQGGTLLKIETDTVDAYKDYFEGIWPKALDKLVEIISEN